MVLLSETIRPFTQPKYKKGDCAVGNYGYILKINKVGIFYYCGDIYNNGWKRRICLRQRIIDDSMRKISCERIK
jgi:hypothetical protein